MVYIVNRAGFAKLLDNRPFFRVQEHKNRPKACHFTVKN